jgi:cytidine deaminase
MITGQKLVEIRESRKLDQESLNLLYNEATKAKQFSYSPYSKFRVGAALLAEDGKIYTGCNVENASYGGTICAERTAFLKAVSEGSTKFLAIAVVTDKEACVSPCGLCRQFMVEFGKDLIVIQCSNTGKMLILDLGKDLLPFSFGPEDM